MNQKIITIAGILFAVIFIVALALVFKNVMGFTDTANKQLTHIQELVESADLSAYDRKVVSGDSVVSAINKLRETSNGTKMSYVVIENNTPTCYGIHKFDNAQPIKSDGSVASDGDTVAYYLAGEVADSDFDSYKSYNKRADEEGFISPVKEYNSYIMITSNGVAVGVVFKEA